MASLQSCPRNFFIHRPASWPSFAFFSNPRPRFASSKPIPSRVDVPAPLILYLETGQRPFHRRRNFLNSENIHAAFPSLKARRNEDGESFVEFRGVVAKGIFRSSKRYSFDVSRRKDTNASKTSKVQIVSTAHYRVQRGQNYRGP